MNANFKLATIVFALSYMIVPLTEHLSFQTQDDYNIKGIWLSNNTSGHHQVEQLEIYPVDNNDKYYGEDPAGRLVLKDLVYNESDKEYSGILASTGGREVSATVVFVDKDTIKITGRRFLHKWSFTMSREKEEK